MGSECNKLGIITVISWVGSVSVVQNYGVWRTKLNKSILGGTPIQHLYVCVWPVYVYICVWVCAWLYIQSYITIESNRWWNVIWFNRKPSLTVIVFYSNSFTSFSCNSQVYIQQHCIFFNFVLFFLFLFCLSFIGWKLVPYLLFKARDRWSEAWSSDCNFHIQILNWPLPPCARVCVCVCSAFSLYMVWYFYYFYVMCLGIFCCLYWV